MLNTRTGERIKHGRRKAGFTQEQLAKKLDVSKQAVSNWERGKNLPDIGLWNDIERVLQIKMLKEEMSTLASTTFLRKIPNIKPLESIGDIDELFEAIKTILDSVELKEYETVVKKLLYLSMVALLGYEIYYEKYCRKYYSDEHDDELDWAATACNIRDLIKIYEQWPLEQTTFQFSADSFLGKKFEWMAYRIGCELFEDFDDAGYRDGFVQRIGRYGETCAYDLINILPDSNTDILVIYKTAILDVAEMLNSCTSNEV